MPRYCALDNTENLLINNIWTSSQNSGRPCSFSGTATFPRGGFIRGSNAWSDLVYLQRFYLHTCPRKYGNINDKMSKKFQLIICAPHVRASCKLDLQLISNRPDLPEPAPEDKCAFEEQRHYTHQSLSLVCEYVFQV